MPTAPLKLRIYDDPVLREKAQPIGQIEPRHRELAAQMAETMYGARGIGLAANQVGVLERIIVVDTEWGGKREKNGKPRNPVTMINPEILATNEELDSYNEGCLSLPQIECDVWRPTQVRLRYQTLEGETLEADTTGMLARCVQHEVDHLNGILFIDHLDPEERQQLAGQLGKLRRARESGK